MKRPLTAMLVMAITAAAILIGAGHSASAQSVAEFYRGKTIRFLYGRGSTYDVYAIIFARHLKRHIPGNPKIIPKSAGTGVSKLNYVYNDAPKDGTVLIMPRRHVTIARALYGKEAKFDPAKFTWIGNVTQMPTAMALWRGAPAKTLKDAQRAEVLVGSFGDTTESGRTPKLLNAVLGTKFKIVPNDYRTRAAINMAMRSGEVHGRSGLWGINGSRGPSLDKWFQATGKVNFIAQVGMVRHPKWRNVPRIQDLATNGKDRKVLEFWSRLTTLSRAIAAPPGIPADRAAALRAAFDKVMKDPAYLADAKKNVMPMIKPMNWKEINQFNAEVAATPKSVIKRFRALLGSQ